MSEIDNLLNEDRRFPPSTEWRQKAVVTDPGIYTRAAADPEAFWAGQARELEWIRPFTKVLEGGFPSPKWFSDGTLNVSANCLDRHVRAGLGDRPAFIWEGEPGDTRTLTYAELLNEVARFAGVLRAQGIRKGDRVALYMPLIPELAIAMLACARIGAVHSVVFGGFSADALRDRINDSACAALVTADGGYRRGNIVPLKQMADAALDGTPSIRTVIVVRRGGDRAIDVEMKAGRDHWYHELMAETENSVDMLFHPPEPMGAEDMLYVLYTSGTTGKPKGIVHTTGGYLTGVATTTKWVFDLRESDIYWCTADIGWVTGHSYVVYGPLANGATVLMYEGAPDWPEKDRFWALVEKHKVTILYTAPTAIRAFMRWGTAWPEKRDLSSLRLLGSVGEPINPEAWTWYREHIGGGRTPVVDTWWQTETGQILITPLPGVTTTKPGSATFPFPGIEADIVDGDGNSVPFGGGGYLVLKRPWPAMLRGIYGDPERYRQTYWSRFPGMYFAGDGAKRDEDGYFWLLGRVDDVMNVAGHRISTTEVESALVDHRSVAEAAVVGKKDEITGEAIFAFVILKAGQEPTDALGVQLREHVAYVIGPIARPKYLMFVPDLPKTRSGKIMRRLLRDIAEGRQLGDTTTLADAGVVDTIRERTGAAEEE